MCRIRLLLSKIRAALALSSCLVVFALQKQHVMLEGKCLTQFICCLVRKKTFWKLNRIIHVSSNFKMSKVMNINIRQMEALEHVKQKGKDIPSNKLVLILVNKKTGVATKCSLFSQPKVLGTGWRARQSNDAGAGGLHMLAAQGWLSAAAAGKKTFSFKKMKPGSDTAPTRTAAFIGISVTQVFGMYTAVFGRYQAKVSAWTWQPVR